MSEFKSTCPLLLESDYLSLSGDFSCRLTKREAVVSDPALDAHHTLLRPSVIASLLDRTSYAQLVARTATEGAKPEELTETLGFINYIGALKVERSWWNKARAIAGRARALVMGVTYHAVTWRRPFSPWALGFGILRASWLVLLLMPLSFFLFVFSGLMPLGQGAVMSLLFISTFWISMVTHELAHVIIIKRHTKQVIIMQTGMRLGLLHPSLPRRAEVSSALAGPCVGMALAMLIGAGCTILGESLLALVAYLVASLHVGSFLPSYGDGATLAAAWRKSRAKA